LNLPPINCKSNLDFLSAASKSKNFETIKSLMSCPGDDCTLRDRFKDVQDLHTKTGTLRHVSSLMGYFKDKKGDQHSFVIMANNFYSYNKPYRELEEEIVRFFIER
jgi:D-alanyl-D-alanine carboxypeptidase